MATPRKPKAAESSTRLASTDPDLDADVLWAESEIERLAKLFPPGSAATFDQHRGQLVSSVEFLRLKAGPRSAFYVQAADAAKRKHALTACNMVMQSLIGWIEFVEIGMAEIPIEAQHRQAAATDLMEQVETLLVDRRVHPAAPVMLVGAALEELLRAMVDIAGLKPTGKPGISSYAAALRADDSISAQDAKDITAWAGMRNEAAHGRFASIELANARLMAQGINLFMQRHTSR